MPVVVQITTPDGSRLDEAAETVAVNAHGCLVNIAAPVAVGQEVQIVNSSSRAEKPCTVVFIARAADGRNEIGLEFSQPAPRFWQIAFPPDDWVAYDTTLSETPVTPRAPRSR